VDALKPGKAELWDVLGSVVLKNWFVFLLFFEIISGGYERCGFRVLGQIKVLEFGGLRAS